MLGDITATDEIYIVCGLSSAYFYPHHLLYSLSNRPFTTKR